MAKDNLESVSVKSVSVMFSTRLAASILRIHMKRATLRA